VSFIVIFGTLSFPVGVFLGLGLESRLLSILPDSDLHLAILKSACSSLVVAIAKQ